MDRDLAGVGFIVWVASIAHVSFTFMRHEMFGAVATVALVLAVALPASVLGRLRT